MNLEFKHLGILGLVVFIIYLLKVRKPSFYGMLFSLLCVYIPISGKYPFSLGYGVNLMNGVYLALLVIGIRRPFRTERDRIWTFGILWGCVCVIALIVATFYDPEAFVDESVELRRLLDPIIVYFFARRLNSESDRWAAIDSVAVGTLLFSTHLFLQGLDMGHKVRVGGFLNQANAAAAFVAAYCPLLLAMYTKCHRIIAKSALLISIGICCLAETQTVSRGGIIGLSLGLVVTAFLSRKLLLKFSILAVILVLILSPSLLPEKVLERFEGKGMSGIEDDHEAEISANLRYEVWRASLSIISSHPFGTGLGGFQRNITKYISERRDSHNVFLRVWSEMGIQGVAVFSILLMQFFMRGKLALGMMRSDLTRLAGLALIGGMSALCVANLVSTTMLNSLVFNYMWVLAAVIGPITRTQADEPIRSEVAT